MFKDTHNRYDKISPFKIWSKSINRRGVLHCQVCHECNEKLCG